MLYIMVLDNQLYLFDIGSFFYRNESEDINQIIENITRLLDNTVLFVAPHPVGVQPRAQHVIKLLNY